MGTLRAIASILLALALVSSAAAHGARSAAMAMPMALAWNADGAEPCGLCAGQDASRAAAHCALVCAGMTAMVSDSADLAAQMQHEPAPGALAPIAGRFADPEPHPPR